MELMEQEPIILQFMMVKEAEKEAIVEKPEKVVVEEIQEYYKQQQQTNIKNGLNSANCKAKKEKGDNLVNPVWEGKMV